jgi:hypothetical protein
MVLDWMSSVGTSRPHEEACGGGWLGAVHPVLLLLLI